MVRNDPEHEKRQFAYRHSGVRILCGFELPEWAPFLDQSETGPFDIAIDLGQVDASDIPADAHGVFGGGCLKFSEKEVGSWSICGGKTITVDPASPKRLTEARLYSLGSAWGALGYQRGWPMLHASAVKIGARSALFAGLQGQGKSTLAASLVGKGLIGEGLMDARARLLADDLSRVLVVDQAQVQIYPSATRIKLWDSAIDHLGLGKRELVRDHFRDRKFHLVADEVAIDPAPVPLSAVFVLEWDDELAIERLRGAQAVRALAEGTMYRKEYLELMGLLGQQIVFAARIASQIPVFRLTRPKDFGHMGEVCERVSQCLEEL